MQRWETILKPLEDLGVEVLAISPDTLEEAAALRRRLRLRVRVLSDDSLRVIDQYNLRHDRALAGGGGRGLIRSLAIPTTLLIGPGGRVRWIDQARDYRVRSDAPRVLEAVRRVLRRDFPSEPPAQ